MAELHQPRAITAEDLIAAMEELNAIGRSEYRYIYAELAIPPVSDEYCIQAFANMSDVIVVDSKGRQWNKGVIWDGE